MDARHVHDADDKRCVPVENFYIEGTKYPMIDYYKFVRQYHRGTPRYDDMLKYIAIGFLKPREYFKDTPEEEQETYAHIPPKIDYDPEEEPERYAKDVQKWENDIRESLISALAEMWLFNDEEKRKKFEFYTRNWGKDFGASPVKIPSWMFAANTFLEENFHFENNTEIVALAHAIHFTSPHCATGYLECSGHIERWCRCTTEEAHEALAELFQRGLLLEPVIIRRDTPNNPVNGVSRNLGWKANIPYIESVLKNYGRRINI